MNTYEEITKDLVDEFASDAVEVERIVIDTANKFREQYNVIVSKDEDDSGSVEDEEPSLSVAEERMSSESSGELLSPQAPRVSARAAQPARINECFILNPLCKEYTFFFPKKGAQKAKKRCFGAYRPESVMNRPFKSNNL